MKGLISAIKRMEIHDGDGIRTTVFFKGCPLHCIWCHNPESICFEQQIAYFSAKCINCGSCVAACSQRAITVTEEGLQLDRIRCAACGQCAKECPTGAITMYGEQYEATALVERLLKDRPFFERSGGGVTLSGGECMAQVDFAVEIAKQLHERGIRVDIDTGGQIDRSALERILPYTDTFLYDVKAIDAEVHRRCTGHTNERILDNLRYLSDRGARLEIRYPLVMGYNSDECDRIGAFLKQIKGIVKVKVLQYHSFAASRYGALGMANEMPNTETTVTDVQRAVDTLKRYGLNAVNGARAD